MNYQEFKSYKEQLQGDFFRMDDLNPYPLAAQFPGSSSEAIEPFYVLDGYHVMLSKGVRESLTEVLKYFSSLGYRIVLPSDVYPEYFNLIPKSSKIHQYACCGNKIVLPRYESCISLVANPLIPEGRYLEMSELEYLDHWLQENKNRWLVLDNVYDYYSRNLDYTFGSKRVIYMNSLSKVNLKPGTLGWAACKIKLPGFEPSIQLKFDQTLSLSIQEGYSKAWRSINYDLNFTREFEWQAPTVGYLSIVNRNFDILLNEYGIAAVPASIFGVKNSELSVISCLSEVR